ncbi:MAG: chemotaxis protein CheW, partial [Thermodesulfobacteriota bacterium]
TKMKIVAFTILDKEYALEIKEVSRVIRMKEITPIPQAPDFVEGVIIWHGKVTPLISLHKKFGLKKHGPNKLNRIIITRFHGQHIGIIVDQVTDVLYLEAANLEPPGALFREANYLVGVGKIGKRLILLMDIEKLLSQQERSSIDKIIIESEDEQFEEKGAKNTLRILGFSLDEENYCIEITGVKEVFTPGIVTSVPNAASFVKGVTNLHGAIISLIDIRPFLGLAGGEVTQTSKVIVAEIEDGLVGIVVDKIFEAREIEKDSIQPPLATLQGKMLELTLGQFQSETGIMVFLAFKNILGSEEFKHKGG